MYLLLLLLFCGFRFRCDFAVLVVCDVLMICGICGTLWFLYLLLWLCGFVVWCNFMLWVDLELLGFG